MSEIAPLPEFMRQAEVEGLRTALSQSEAREKALREALTAIEGKTECKPGPDGIVDADWELACVLLKARETLSWGYQHTKTPERKNYTHYPVAAFDLCLAEAKAVRLHLASESN